MARRVRLVDELSRVRPEAADPDELIADGRVLVDGRYVTNPASMVERGCSIVIDRPKPLRGSAKLAAGLDAFGVSVDGRVCLDVGAAAGGFTAELLTRGAARVYAVDVGHGQLLGSLAQDPRVVSLERTNVADLDAERIPEPIDLVTLDVSYLSLASAVAQLAALRLAPGAELVGLVKPMFELARGQAPRSQADVDLAVARAADGIERGGWSVRATMRSPITGSRGIPEGLVHAVTARPPDELLS